MSKGRKIICVQDIIISAMVTNVITRVIYNSVTGWRLILLFAVVMALFYRTLDDITRMVLRGVKHEKAGTTDKRGSVSGKHWSEERFADHKQENRNPTYEFIQVS